jgi:hypothetical protein
MKRDGWKTLAEDTILESQTQAEECFKNGFQGGECALYAAG